MSENCEIWPETDPLLRRGSVENLKATSARFGVIVAIRLGTCPSTLPAWISLCLTSYRFSNLSDLQGRTRSFGLGFLLTASLWVISTLVLPGVSLPSNIDHSTWSALLKEYVDERGLVDYGRWKNSEADLGKLNDYLERFAEKSNAKAVGWDEAASFINAYNAFTIYWILLNYPIESILELDRSWAKERFIIGGEKVSLDQIEHTFLRPIIGWKAHAVLVCAARSCPPLRRTAYSAATLDTEIDNAYKRWLSRPDLNSFDYSKQRIEVSAIFDWFEEDFVEKTTIAWILLRYAPEKHHGFIQSGRYRIAYKEYHWGLNDQSELGIGYKRGILKWLLGQ